MIEKFRESRLIKVVALSVCSITVIYLIAALFLLLASKGDTSRLYLLPTIETASLANRAVNDPIEAQKNFNHGMSITLYFLIIYYFAEGIVLLLAMHRVKDFKEDFNMLDELKGYTLCWLFLSNLVLFVTIQGSYSGFLTLQQINRYKTVLYILRSLAAVSICAIPPLLETFRDASFFPIPPNRESIESVDMVLHIPVAIDFFYDYLKNRHNPDGIHWFALYIDLRLYDGICLDEESSLEDIVEMAQKIKQEYLDIGAEY